VKTRYDALTLRAEHPAHQRMNIKI